MMFESMKIQLILILKVLRIKLKIIEIRSNSETIYFDEDLNLIDEFSPISSLPGEKIKFSQREPITS